MNNINVRIIQKINDRRMVYIAFAKKISAKELIIIGLNLFKQRKIVCFVFYN